MLEGVPINGLGVMDDAVLELSAGFTALTGETGAGKTMVVTALGLLFGGRADPARVRAGAARASVGGGVVGFFEVGRVGRGGEISTTRGPRSCSAARCRPKAGRERSRAGIRSRCPCSRCWPMTWWRC